MVAQGPEEGIGHLGNISLGLGIGLYNLCYPAFRGLDFPDNILNRTLGSPPLEVNDNSVRLSGGGDTLVMEVLAEHDARFRLTCLGWLGR